MIFNDCMYSKCGDIIVLLRFLEKLIINSQMKFDDLKVFLHIFEQCEIPFLLVST